MSKGPNTLINSLDLKACNLITLITLINLIKLIKLIILTTVQSLILIVQNQNKIPHTHKEDCEWVGAL